MKTGIHPIFESIRVTQVIASLVFLLTGLVLTGWIADIRDLKSLIPLQPVIAANCACSWMTLSASLFLICTNSKSSKVLGTVLASLSLIVGALLLYGGYANQTYDWCTIQWNDQAAALDLPGQMLFQESGPIVLLCTTLLLSQFSFRRRLQIQFALLLLAILPALQALVGYLTSNPLLFTFCTASQCAHLNVLVAAINVIVSMAILTVLRKINR